MVPVEEYQLRELPDTVTETAGMDLVKYTVGFINVESTPPDSKGWALLGSGTLVSVGLTHAILTAHHVLSVLPREGRLGLLLSPTIQQYTVDTQGLAFVPIARGPKEAEGPDLGAIVLAPSIAGSIGAKKTFYSLDSRRDRMLRSPPGLRDGFWIVNGYLDERTVVERDEAGFVKRFYYLTGTGGPDECITNGDYDYFDFPVSYAGRPAAPKSFGGMSGGGLWQIPLTRDAQGEITYETPLFSGVVFYQEPTTEVSCGVKCHGRLSVYDIAFKAIEGKKP